MRTNQMMFSIKLKYIFFIFFLFSSFRFKFFPPSITFHIFFFTQSVMSCKNFKHQIFLFKSKRQATSVRSRINTVSPLTINTLVWWQIEISQFLAFFRGEGGAPRGAEVPSVNNISHTLTLPPLQGGQPIVDSEYTPYDMEVFSLCLFSVRIKNITVYSLIGDYHIECLISVKFLS